MSEYRLQDLPVGSMARIEGIRPSYRSYRAKLLAMGLTRGTPVLVQRIAPLGDPVLIEVRGFELSLRKEEANALILSPLEGTPEDHGFFGGSHHRPPGHGPRGKRGHHGRGNRAGRGRRRFWRRQQDDLTTHGEQHGE